MRKKEEIEEKIQEVEKYKWWLSMKDKWNTEDYEADSRFSFKLYKLREELKICLSNENSSVLTAEAKESD